MNSLIAVALLLVTTNALQAADPPNERRVDRDGEPLPEGAVARFGSARLLHGSVLHVEFAPDGKSLATSGEDGVRLWNVADGKQILSAHLPRTGAAVLTFTPDGAHVLGDGRGCRVIDPATGKVRCFWQHLGKRPLALVVAADGKSAAAAWEEGGVTVHDLAGEGRRTGRTLSDAAAAALALSADGGMLAAATEKSIALWDVRRGRLLHTFAGGELNEKHLFSFCLSRDGGRLAASWGDKVRLWDTASGEEVKGFAGPRAEAVFLRFSADGAELAGVSSYQHVWRWSAKTGKERDRSSSPDKTPYPFRYSSLSPDGRTVAGATSMGSHIHLWDATTWKELVAVERWPEWRGVAFVKPGVAAVLTGGRTPEEVIAFWDVSDGRLLKERRIAVPEHGWWRQELSPDGKLLAAENEKKGVLLFDVESGKEVRYLDPPRRGDEGAKFAFSPDGKTIVTTHERGGLMIWDPATGKSLGKIQGVDDGAMAFAPDGRSVASAFVGRFDLTEVASGKVRLQLPLAESKERELSESVIDRIRFARDGRSVAAISRTDIYVFSTARGKTLLHLELGGRTNTWTETGALSPDGRWLAHGNNWHGDVSVRDLHNPGAAAECQTLPGHAAGVMAVEFSPDGKYLVSCSEDGTALVWEVKRLTGKAKPQGRDVQEPDAQDADAQWDLLGDADAVRAGRAMAALEEFPEAATAVLKARLKPVEAPPAGRIDRLIADLDSDTFEVRQQAFKELSRLGEHAAPALRKALEGKPSAEMAKRAKELLSDLEGPVTDPQLLRQLRAVELLGRIGSPAARKVLQELAKGSPHARLTREAKASLERWPTP
jgi:WD40 repeat protein